MNKLLHIPLSRASQRTNFNFLTSFSHDQEASIYPDKVIKYIKDKNLVKIKLHILPRSEYFETYKSNAGTLELGKTE